MPRKHEIEVFKFDELSPKAKERAMRDYLGIGGSFDSEMITESFQERLKDLGLPHQDIRWSLSYSQGDGVAFYGPVDLEKYLGVRKGPKEWSPRQRDLNALLDKVEVNIKKRTGSHLYDHWNTMIIETDVTEDLIPKEQKLLDKLEEDLQRDIIKVSKELEKEGYSELEYRQSEEYLSEVFDSNEFEFHADGRLFS